MGEENPLTVNLVFTFPEIIVSVRQEFSKFVAHDDAYSHRAWRRNEGLRARADGVSELVGTLRTAASCSSAVLVNSLFCG